jgi:hypothetical protein
MDLLDASANVVRSIGSFFGLGGYYESVDSYMLKSAQNVSDQAYNAAIKSGETPIAALNSANAALEPYANPSSLADWGGLIGKGFEGMKHGINSINQPALADVAPLLIGAGVIGGGYLAANAFLGSAPAPTPTPTLIRPERLTDVA